MKSLPVILAGYGHCARNYTVVPVLRRFPGTIHVVGVTSLLEGEFDELIRPEFRRNGWPIPRLHHDLEDACDERHFTKGKPKAVLLTTPNALHFHQAKMAIEAGYHVYVERPIVTANDDLPALIKLAERNHVLLCTGVQRRLEAPYRYIHSAVTQKRFFGQLRHIRCRLAVKYKLRTWRRRSDMSGGGIAIDSGYHLLDIAAWLLESIGIHISEELPGAVHFGSHEPSPSNREPLDVETEAVGYVELPNDILLSFDFSYNAPEDTVFEQIEVVDQNGARIGLTRDQTSRSSLPGTITHQLPDGSFAEINTSAIERGIRAEAVRFSDETQIAKPLRMFAEAVKKGIDRAPCVEALQAQSSVSTWHLVREVYRHASKKREHEY
jgi:predicted dehydrogenase